MSIGATRTIGMIVAEQQRTGAGSLEICNVRRPGPLCYHVGKGSRRGVAQQWLESLSPEPPMHRWLCSRSDAGAGGSPRSRPAWAAPPPHQRRSRRLSVTSRLISFNLL